MTPFTKQSELAHECAELAMRMPDTVENLKLILSGVLKAVSDVTWGDLSLVESHLEEALEALEEARAFSDSEIADWARERMQIDREAA